MESGNETPGPTNILGHEIEYFEELKDMNEDEKAEIGKIVTVYFEARNEGNNTNKEKFVESASTTEIRNKAYSLCNFVDFLIEVKKAWRQK